MATASNCEFSPVEIARLHDLSHANDPFWLNLFRLCRWPTFASFSSLLVIICFGGCLGICLHVRGQRVRKLGELELGMGTPKQEPNEGYFSTLWTIGLVSFMN